MTMSWYKVIYAEKRSCENKEKKTAIYKAREETLEETRTANNLLSDSTYRIMRKQISLV